MVQEDKDPFASQNDSDADSSKAKARKVLVKDAQPDMILAKPVIDKNGRTIINKGAKLTSLFISKLSKWGIETVVVDGQYFEKKPEKKKPSSGIIQAYRPVVEEPKVDVRQEQDPEKELKLERRFSNVAHNDKMLGFMLLSKKYLLGKNVDPERIPELVEQILDKG